MMKQFVGAFLALSVLFLCGCTEEPSGETGGAAPAATVDFSRSDSEMFTDRDYKTDDEDAVTVDLSESGGTFTVTAPGTYRLTGRLEGTVVVDAPDTAKVQLVLDGADIHNETGAAIRIEEADKVFLTLAQGSENSLSCGETLEDGADAALYSRCDLTLNGEGSLTVTAPGGHGISCKDDLAITGGSYTVACVGQGLDANDSVRICAGTFAIDAGKDGIHAENAEDAAQGFIYLSGGTYDLEAEGDGISASAWLQIENGSIDILAGGGWENGEQHSSDNWGGMGGGPGGMRPRSTESSEDSTSMKGLKAGAGLLISNGSFTVDSADDALHSNTTLTVNGGDFTIASGDDGIHAEETLTVTAGTVAISTCYEGLEAHEIRVSGGNITLKATDDGLNAAGGVDGSGTGGRDEMFGGGPGGMGGGNSTGYIEISGGKLYINSSGDGIDANGSVLISGGETVVVGPTTGDTATLDYDTSCAITGGTFIGTGSSMMAQTFSAGSQGVFACRVGNQSAGTKITLKDEDGNVLFEHTPELDFAVVILSSPALVSGQEYTVTVGNNSGTLEAE